MADLDTRSKRASSVGLYSPFILSVPEPTGDFDEADREHMAWTYSGIDVIGDVLALSLGAAITNSSTLNAPALLAVNALLAPTRASTATVVAPSLATGAVTLTLPFIASSATIRSHVVHLVGGIQTITQIVTAVNVGDATGLGYDSGISITIGDSSLLIS